MAKKKRYKQNTKDRMYESRGMMRYDYHMDTYGMPPERRKEYEDSMMIHEDHKAIANLPQHVIMHEYPKCPYSKYHLDDTIRGVDVQISDDMKKKKSGPYPEKY